jgi:formate hydrogenlyase transcriptional activator
MAVVAFSPARLGSQEELQPFERLLVGLSSSFSAPGNEECDGLVPRALGDIAAALGVDEYALIALHERGGASVVHSWAAPPHVPFHDDDLAAMPWVMEQLSRNAVVALTPEDLPQRQSSDASRLAVPLAAGSRIAYGVIAGRRQQNGEWRTPFIHRLRLAGELLVAGLERRRTDETRRETPAAIEPEEEAAAAATHRDQIIGASPAFRLALERLDQVAPLDATTLLLGETGTGKEIFARALHERSRRRTRPLVRVNCAALPPTLIESELFGHERGAFTGAVATRQGRFELADGGTLFLDEIGDLALDLQAKLLRVLQEGEFERVGASKTRRVNVRVIAATHLNLAEAVAAGRFRSDLYYRLSVFPIELPPLRERRDDIPQLVWYLISRHQRTLRRRITHVPASVIATLQEHDWPGNVRELENVIERAMIRSADGTLQLDDLPRHTSHVSAPPSAAPARAPSTDSLDALQRQHIERVLRECGGRINGPGNAAVRLGIHPNTLRFRMKKLGVSRPSPRVTAANPARHE